MFILINLLKTFLYPALILENTDILKYKYEHKCEHCIIVQYYFESCALIKLLHLSNIMIRTLDHICIYIGSYIYIIPSIYYYIFGVEPKT